jgi:hypothetical protein
MNHIKLFEGYLDQYYQKMEDDFSYFDIEDLVQDMDKCDWIENNLKEGVKKISQRPTNLILEKKFDIPRGKEYHRYNIMKCQDEYYYVKVITYMKKNMSSDTKYISDFWYKCDQFDGLKKFLRDENLIS